MLAADGMRPPPPDSVSVGRKRVYILPIFAICVCRRRDYVFPLGVVMAAMPMVIHWTVFYRLREKQIFPFISTPMLYTTKWSYDIR